MLERDEKLKVWNSKGVPVDLKLGNYCGDKVKCEIRCRQLILPLQGVENIRTIGGLKVILTLWNSLTYDTKLLIFRFSRTLWLPGITQATQNDHSENFETNSIPECRDNTKQTLATLFLILSSYYFQPFYLPKLHNSKLVRVARNYAFYSRGHPKRSFELGEVVFHYTALFVHR